MTIPLDTNTAVAEHRSHRPWLWCLAVLPLLPVLWIGFLGDDFVALALLRERGWAQVARHLAPEGYIFLRPLGWLVFQLERLAAGGQPVIIHLIHLGMFIAAAWQAGRLARHLGGRPVAGWAAALALLYPGRVEAYAWISGLFDLLALLVVLTALRVLVAEPRRWRTVSLAGLAFLAPFAKETGFSLPVVALTWTLLGVTGSASRRRRWLDVGAFCVGAGGAMAYRLLVFGSIGGYPGTTPDHALRGLAALPAVLLRTAFLPVNPTAPQLAWPVAAATALAGVVVVLALLGVDVRGRRLIAAGLTLAGLGALPVLPYLTPEVVWHHSRYLTLVGAGLALAASAAAGSRRRLSRIAPGLLAAAWALAVVVNLLPWLEAARHRDVILDEIERATRSPGRHVVWVAGPINQIRGAHLLGGNLDYAVRAMYPERDIAVDSAFHQRLRNAPVGPPDADDAARHLFRFDPAGPALEPIPPPRRRSTPK